jgi:hypothetical protein
MKRVSTRWAAVLLQLERLWRAMGRRWGQSPATAPLTWEQKRRASCGALVEPGRHCNDPVARVRPPNTIPTCDVHANVVIGAVDRRFDPPVCDFCLAPDPDDDARLYFVHGFTVQLDPDDPSQHIRFPPQRYGACPACHAAVQAHDLDTLVRRQLEGARRAGAPSAADPRAEEAARLLFGTILQQIDEYRPPVPAWQDTRPYDP